VEVDCSQLGWTRCPRVVDPGASEGQGRPPPKPRLGKGAAQARRVDALWKRGGPSWQAYHVKNTDKGSVVWEVRAVRFFPCESGLPGTECRLLVARNVPDGEVKYFLSNASADTPVAVLLPVAFSRWHIERVFEDGKGEVGLDHFEVRRYRSLMRHPVLSMVSFPFLVQETQRLQKNPLGTICPVRAAVELQLDPHVSRRERLRRLDELARKIDYWQRHAEQAVRVHTKRRYRRLRALGIYVSKLPKCYHFT
jgi:hypothetical protein